MQEILAEIWPPLIMVLFGTVSVVAAILGKAICSLDQNSFFLEIIQQFCSCLIFSPEGGCFLSSTKNV